jgi:hypothetical protein
MSEQCLETIDSTTQNKYEWVARIAEELQRMADSLLHDMHSLVPALASAA